MIKTKMYLISVAYHTPWDLTKRKMTHYTMSNPSDAYKIAVAGGFSADTHFTQVNEMTTLTFSPDSGLSPSVTFSENIALEDLRLMAEGYDAIKFKEKEAAALEKLEKSIKSPHVIDDTRIHQMPRK